MYLGYAARLCENPKIQSKFKKIPTPAVFLAMIFDRSGAKEGTARNTGRVDRRALVTTSSDGGSALFMVRNQLVKLRQTNAV